MSRAKWKNSLVDYAVYAVIFFFALAPCAMILIVMLCIEEVTR